MFRSLLYLFALSMVIVSCENESETYTSPDRRDQFTGRYRVVNANPPYEFQIIKFDSVGQPWVRFKNFANAFDLERNFTQNLIPSNMILFPHYDVGEPIRDKNGNRFTFAVYSNPTVPDNQLLHQDTLKVYFRIQNALWWFEDDTTGIDQYYLHTAVKIK